MSKQPKPKNLPVLPPVPVASDDEGDSKKPGMAPGNQRTESPVNQQPDSLANAPGSPYQAHGHNQVPRHRFLSPAERSVVAKGIGGVRDVEDHGTAHPTSWWWPPMGMPRGLYRDIVTCKTKFNYVFHAISIIRWTLMVAQLLIGATVTSLGSMSLQSGISITILGAVNTVIAGLLALLHNSGLPDRYRYDKAQFEELEDHIKELLDSGIAPVEQTADQILAECFDLFREAKATVTANMPVNYNSRKALQTGNMQDQASPPPAPSPPGTSSTVPSPKTNAGEKARQQEPRHDSQGSKKEERA
ncbi:C6 transcription factor [Hirsutella rhossiliensis]|uniref:C6 transcription factor n=1 Tax=Hirsutella rhossiliensis TaxID=111463 RepID=A0A9P8N4R8_9HYPO|nr:C6 transcription factor [Hirsutella rhossiliensis]KAH0965789.1 C6 transcription factor [Hirsutella rhossiliensis]